MNTARTVWITVGAIAYALGVGFLGFPVFAGMFGAPIDLGLAFLLATIGDLVLAGVYVAGILIARRDATGRLRAVPPAIAFGVLVVGFIVAGNVIFAVAAR